jgi:hypothetical protein
MGRQYRIRPTNVDVLLLIEVSDSSAEQDMGEKARLYAEHDIHPRAPDSKPRKLSIDPVVGQIRLHQPPLPTNRDIIAS